MQTARRLELTIYALLLIGLVFIYNSSIVHSQNVFGDPHRFFILHLGWIVISLIGYFVISRIKITHLLDFSPIVYGATFIMLVFLAFWGILPCEMSVPFAPCLNSANRWIVFNPAPLPQFPFIGELNLQPSELAKIAIILFLAFKLKNITSKKDDTAFKIYLIYTALFSGLIILEPNMSTSLLVFVIGTAIYFSSGHSLKPFVILIPTMLLISVFFMIMSPYRRERLMTYMNHTQSTSATAEGYQVKQVKIALGSGGLFGVGFGQSRQKYTYLPEVATDSIFAVIGEEFGFIGTLSILGAFLFLIFNGIETAKNAPNLQLRFIAVGITTWIGSQFLIHMSANAGLIPYTGVPLPLISYGGSSLLFSMLGLGLLTNISRQSRYN